METQVEEEKYTYLDDIEIEEERQGVATEPQEEATQPLLPPLWEQITWEAIDMLTDLQISSEFGLVRGEEKPKSTNSRP